MSSAKDTGKPFWQRGFIPLVVTFLVGSWTFLEFLNFILERYFISHTWVDISLVALTGLFPSVLLYSWSSTHGVEKIFKIKDRWIYLINIVMVIVVEIVVFYGDDLGSQKESMRIMNEYGVVENIEKFKPEFRDHILVYDFSITDTITPVWKSRAISKTIITDLSQFDGVLASHIAGTLSSKEKYATAKNLNAHLLVDGTINSSENKHFLNLNLSNKNGKVIISETFEGTSLLPLVDSATVLIINNVRHASYLKDQVDLKLEELYTNNEDALAAFFNGDAELAVVIDSTFAIASLDMAVNSYFFNLGVVSFNEHIRKAYQSRNKVTVADELLIKAFYFISKKEIDKATLLLQNYQRLVPNYKNSIHLLQNVYLALEQYDPLIELLENLVEEQPGDVDVLLQLAKAYMTAQYFDDAEDLLDSFIQNNPNILESKYTLVMLLIIQKEYDDAKRILEEIQLEIPHDPIADMLSSSIEYYDKSTLDRIDKIIGLFEGNYANQTTGNLTISPFKNIVGSKYDNQRLVFNALVNDSTAYYGHRSIDNLSYADWRLQYRLVNNRVSHIDMYQSIDGTDRFYRNWRMDPRLFAVRALIKEQTYDSAALILSKLSADYPMHHFIADYQEHVQLMLASRRENIEFDYEQFTGKYGDREIFLKNGVLNYRRSMANLIWPLKNDFFMFPYDPGFKIQVVRRQNDILGLRGWYYSHEHEKFEANTEDLTLLTDKY